MQQEKWEEDGQQERPTTLQRNHEKGSSLSVHLLSLLLFSLMLFSFLRCFSFLDVFELFWCPFRSDIDFRFLFRHLLSSHMKNRSFDDIFWCFQRETSELLESVLMSLDSRHLYGYTRSKTCLEESNIASKVWMIWCICFHSFCFSTNAFCSLRDFYHIHRLLTLYFWCQSLCIYRRNI